MPKVRPAAMADIHSTDEDRALVRIVQPKKKLGDLVLPAPDGPTSANCAGRREWSGSRLSKPADPRRNRTSRYTKRCLPLCGIVASKPIGSGVVLAVFRTACIRFTPACAAALNVESWNSTIN